MSALHFLLVRKSFFSSVSVLLTLFSLLSCDSKGKKLAASYATTRKALTQSLNLIRSMEDRSRLHGQRIAQVSSQYNAARREHAELEKKLRKHFLEPFRHYAQIGELTSAQTKATTAKAKATLSRERAKAQREFTQSLKLVTKLMKQCDAARLKVARYTLTKYRLLTRQDLILGQLEAQYRKAHRFHNELILLDTKTKDHQ